MAKPGCVVASVGGGGLLMGVLSGLADVGWADVPVVAVETHGADALAQSLAAGELVTLPAITSVAKSLGADCTTERILRKCQDLGPDLVRPLVVSDAAAVRACLAFADDHRVLVEPACGAALAAVYDRAEVLQGLDDVVVEVCGGGIVTPALLDQYKALVDA